jgi:hypothetical protein
MADLTQAPEDSAANRRQIPARAPRVTRRDWSTRGAVFFWIAASGMVWIALAVSAAWFG